MSRPPSLERDESDWSECEDQGLLRPSIHTEREDIDARESFTHVAPPPPPASRQARSRENGRTASSLLDSLDFEQVVNDYSIQAARDRLQLEHMQESETLFWQGDEDDGESDSILNNKKQSYQSFDQTVLINNLHTKENFSKIFTFQKKPKARIFGFVGRTAMRWLLTVMTGLITGLTSLFIVYCTDTITTQRSILLDYLWRKNRGDVETFTLYASISLALAIVSALLCIMVAPAAVGSGIPEIKAYLNGVRMKRFASLRLFIAKVVGTILSVSSGLAKTLVTK
jgi:Voltage gated chloride channel